METLALLLLVAMQYNGTGVERIHGRIQLAVV
jgi:hypothetical protein